MSNGKPQTPEQVPLPVPVLGKNGTADVSSPKQHISCKEKGEAGMDRYALSLHGLKAEVSRAIG
jgi:hypothetical protein